jgi:phosphoribosylamine--glycine ligase
VRILLLGSGGREHAFAYVIAKSPLCTKLFIAPGNPGTEKHGENIHIPVTDFDAIRNFVLEQSIDMVVVGPEDPLVKGIYDFLSADPRTAQVAVIGPSARGAQLEGSKDFAKSFMKKYGIPTARYEAFGADEVSLAMEYVNRQPMPVVLKADGLAAGKGVLICETAAQAQQGLAEMMLNKKFGAAGERVVIEEFLHGTEMSCFILTDGHEYVMLPSAKDYKRIGEGDQGLNTGGMGAISPVPFAGEPLMKAVEECIIVPVMNGLRQEQIVYKGFLYIGLMISNGEPYVIEFNCRMGDPETQVVLPRITTDLVDLMLAAHQGHLHQRRADVLPYAAVTIVLASQGYPGEYEKGKLIENLALTRECLVFHAGTRRRMNGDIETSGGRVLSVTAFGRQLSDAKELAIRNASLIMFEGKYFRRDIGDDVMNPAS